MAAPKNQAEAVAYLRNLAAQNETSLSTKNEAEIVAQSEKAAVGMTE